MNTRQSDLELAGFERRDDLVTRSDYNKNDEYNREHEDAKTHNDKEHPLGKGTDTDYSHSVPQTYNALTKNKIKAQINTSDGGGSYDKYGRNGIDGGRIFALNINKYSDKNPYYEAGQSIVDTSLNIAEGQFQVK